MKIGLAFLFALPIGTCPLSAQYTHVPQMHTSGVNGVQTLVLATPPGLSSCPVSMRAQHLSDGSLMKTGKTAHPAGLGQRLHLTLKNPDAKQIAGASVTIRGMTPRGRVMQTLSTAGDSSDATRQMSVSFSTESDGSATADLWVSGITAVQSVELDSVAYSDGSTWKVAAGDACRITPDPLMLISGR